MAAAVTLLAMSSVAALAANAVATRPASVHAAPSTKSSVIGLIDASQTVAAKNCRKGWCAAASGYVQSAYLRFSRADESYDYNVPLAFPPYGYSPGFWGYGGRRHYDKYGNYSKFGQGDYPARRGDSGLIETIPRSRYR